MATIVSHVVKTTYCERVRKNVDLVEERIYPNDVLPDSPGAPYLVKNRKCSIGIDCNLVGYACKWSGLNPDYDPFSL
jgi:hypothetical protein